MLLGTGRHMLRPKSRQSYQALVKYFFLLWILLSIGGLMGNTKPRAGSRNRIKLKLMQKKITHELRHFPLEIASNSMGFPLQKPQNVSGDERKPTEEDREANIAFFVQISESNIILVPRLLSRIWHPKNIYCLHIDMKISPHTKMVFEDVFNKNERFKNIFLLPSTVITYAGISMVLNTLDSIEALLERDQSWDYYINLSGSDYPLVSPIGIRRLFGQRPPNVNRTSFIHFSQARSSWDRLLEHRLRFLHFDPSLGFHHQTDKQLIQTFTRHPVVLSKDINITIPKGEAWIIAHRSFCREVISGTLSRRLLTLFANMQSPAEHFFQTLSWNHRGFNDTTARHSFRLVRWKTADGKPSRQHPVYLDNYSGSGKWLYWGSIRASRDLFARKFRVPNSLLMGHIDKYLSGMGENISDTSFAKYFYQRVNRRLNCLASAGSIPQRNAFNCRKQRTAFRPPNPPPAALLGKPAQ